MAELAARHVPPKVTFEGKNREQPEEPKPADDWDDRSDELDGAGAAPRLDTKEKEELLQMGLHLERVQAESEMLQQRIRRKAA